MHPMLAAWIACPKCGGDLAAENGAARCTQCATVYGARGDALDLVDPGQKVSAEGPGDTRAMAWRRRRWDELRGPEAPENAAYLSAIWEQVRPDDRVLDLGCGPGSFLGWLSDFGPDLALLGLDMSWSALEEAEASIGERENVAFARASSRRRLPLKDGSCDVVLRRLAPGLPEEIARVLAPGGLYLRFTFGPQHWHEVYDLLPGLPRAREDALAAEREQLVALGLEVEEPMRGGGEAPLTLPAVRLAIRSNPAAFHAERFRVENVKELWRRGGKRLDQAALTLDYAILVAKKPAPVDEKPKRTRKAATKAAETEATTGDGEAEATAKARQTGESGAPAKTRRTRKTAAAIEDAAEGAAAPAETAAEGAIAAAEATSEGDAPAEPATGEVAASAEPTKRVRARKATVVATEPEPPKRRVSRKKPAPTEQDDGAPPEPLRPA